MLNLRSTPRSPGDVFTYAEATNEDLADLAILLSSLLDNGSPYQEWFGSITIGRYITWMALPLPLACAPESWPDAQALGRPPLL